VEKHPAQVLTINGGSSSIKFALYGQGDALKRNMRGMIDRIGLREAAFSYTNSAHRHQTQSVGAVDHRAAAKFLFDWLDMEIGLASIRAIGHRVVTGGTRYLVPARVDADLLAELRRLSASAPEHLPAEIAMIELCSERLPGLPQVACFDTTFHNNMPRVAKILPLPRRYQAQGVVRRGFHGLSCTYLMEELARAAGAKAAHERVILCHLGNGASVTAVRAGKSIDTSMAFTPAAGVPMSTRSGDLDPGLVRYFAETEHMTAAQFDRMVNHESGLLGISETSSDMQDLLAREADDSRAAEAVAHFCYHVKKWIGAMAAALGGLDTLVFAGGIGENSPAVRARICEDLGFLGVRFDAIRNSKSRALISTDKSRVQVRVIRTDEDAIIARAVFRSVRP
jgi:acetate kinase